VLRGKTEALPAFQPLRRDQFDDLATNGLLEAFANSKRMIPQRRRHLPRMSANAPEDHLASFHLKRLLNGATGTRTTMD
jgi:adenylate cyclase